MSIRIEVSQRGLDLSGFAGKIADQVLPGLVKAAVEYGYAVMSAKAPVRSGRLLGSIKKHAYGLEGSIGPTVPYAVYVEYGTAPHEIRPVFASVLAFQVEGRTVFTPLVHHPGTRPNPFVRTTRDDIVKKIPELWETTVAEEVR